MSNEENIIICRCEDITLQDVLDAIKSGITHPEELKRFLHVGMGPCQGRTCGRMVNQILSQHTGKAVSEIKATGQRPPLVSVPVKEFLVD